VLPFILASHCAAYPLLRSAIFYVFLDAIVDMKEEQVYIPRNITELNRVSEFYGVAGLPGCCGSVDGVHVKWANCPSGDFNRAKGKESYPTLGFQCIADFNRRILSIYGPQFGTRNDMDIVKRIRTSTH
jgi:hypothetical protein